VSNKSLKEACGICGVCSFNQDSSKLIYQGLITLQHRGQESCGISTFDKERISLKKSMGLVTNFFTENVLSELKGKMGLGHVRYSTAGTSCIDDAQPIMTNYPKRGIVLGFNGNIVNFTDLRKQLSLSGRLIQSKSDAEVITHIIAEEFIRTKDIETAIYNCMNRIEGAYSVGILTGEGELIVFRDPYGFKPLVFGQNEEMKMFASESVAMDINGIENVSDINPGEVMIIREENKERKQLFPCTRKAHCMFEYVYFSRPDSILNGKCVYDARIKLGQNLAKTFGGNGDIIVPVPDTARPVAEGIARETGLPVIEGLIKNRYVFRTFIMPEQQSRDKAIKVKLNPVRSVLKDKHVILVDDSIVRGTTSRRTVDLIKNAGAKRVDMWISCPPIVSPCFYGIDMATHVELVAANNPVPKIAEMIHADELCYQTIEGLIDATGFKEDELCIACLNGRYPTPKAQQLADGMKNQTTLKRYHEVES
jgi:amidophosphoribosyltransferase